MISFLAVSTFSMFVPCDSTEEREREREVCLSHFWETWGLCIIWSLNLFLLNSHTEKVSNFLNKGKRGTTFWFLKPVLAIFDISLAFCSVAHCLWPKLKIGLFELTKLFGSGFLHVWVWRTKKIREREGQCLESYKQSMWFTNYYEIRI